MIIRSAGLWIEQGQLLTLRYRYGGQDRFNLPGGNWETGEEIKAGLIREFQEELRVGVEVGDLLFTAETKAGGREVLHLLFPINTMDGLPIINRQETKALDLVWLNPKTLGKAPLYPSIGSQLAQWMDTGVVTHTYLGQVFQEWID
jgi:8-oxo-dGTP diphosphatase